MPAARINENRLAAGEKEAIPWKGLFLPLARLFSLIRSAWDVNQIASHCVLETGLDLFSFGWPRYLPLTDGKVVGNRKGGLR